MKLKNVDVIISLIFISIGISLYRYMLNNHSVEVSRFPRALIVLLIFCSGILLIKSLVSKVESKEKFKIDNLKLVFIFILFMLAYIILINFIGYYIPTLLFIGITMKLFSINKIKSYLAVLFAFGITIYVVFDTLLNVPLP